MIRASEITLGDLVRAFRKLGADRVTRFEIAKLLKLTPFESLEELIRLEQEEEARRQAGPQVESSVKPPEPSSLDQPLPEDAPDTARRDIPAAPSDSSPVRSEVKKVGGRVQGSPSWAGNFEPLPNAPSAAAAATPTPVKKFEPLLLPNWTRAILSGALSRKSHDGPVNVGKVVNAIARGEMVTALPRYPRPTLSRGVQVLVDRGATMLPFADDQRWLEREIRLVVGEENAQILSFEGCPTRRAGRGPRSEWKTYGAHYRPRRGTVLLLLTDLGIGRPPSPGTGVRPEEWRSFAEDLRKRGCPLVALVPYAPARWPPALGSLITIVQWDRTTGAPLIHARVGKGHSSSGTSSTERVA
ncbi:MAG: hypothetical protein LC802_09325 [Acidobacteria bacterium]|nr:hypothetical protein [Acidobacteriota bacterium]